MWFLARVNIRRRLFHIFPLYSTQYTMNVFYYWAEKTFQLLFQTIILAIEERVFILSHFSIQAKAIQAVNLARSYKKNDSRNNFNTLLKLLFLLALLRRLLFNSLCFTTISHCVLYSSSTTPWTKITSCKARNVRKLVSLDSFPFSNRWSISVPFCCQHVHFKNTIDQTHVSPV